MQDDDQYVDGEPNGELANNLAAEPAAESSSDEPEADVADGGLEHNSVASNDDDLVSDDLQVAACYD